MQNARLCFVTLCSVLVLCSFISSSHSARCCLRYARHSPSCSRILGYSNQTIGASCDINAIVFRLRTRFVCADPESAKTCQRLECFKRRRRTRAVREESGGHNTDS